MTEPVRPAATVILWRDRPAGAEVLMGQRGAQAVFMPSKYVFPGGAVDAGDHGDPAMVGPDCARRLAVHAPADVPASALIGAALREVAEETGLALRPLPGVLRFVFRAITPPGRTRRFDARFFLAPATAVDGDPEDFGAAADELRHLHWIGLRDARALDLPFITEVVLSEVTALLAGQTQPGVPFFDNSGARPVFHRLV